MKLKPTEETTIGKNSQVGKTTNQNLTNINPLSNEPNKKRKSNKKTVHSDLMSDANGVCPTCNEIVRSFDELERHMFLNHNHGVLCQQVIHKNNKEDNIYKNQTHYTMRQTKLNI